MKKIILLLIALFLFCGCTNSPETVTAENPTPLPEHSETQINEDPKKTPVPELQTPAPPSPPSPQLIPEATPLPSPVQTAIPSQPPEIEYTSLEELAQNYTLCHISHPPQDNISITNMYTPQQAANDGCVVIEGIASNITANEDRWDWFAYQTQMGIDASVRLCAYYQEVFRVYDITYSNKEYLVTWFDSGSLFSISYRFIEEVNFFINDPLFTCYGGDIESAKADGCIIEDLRTIVHGMDIWLDFIGKCERGECSTVRIARCDPNGVVYDVYEIEYNGTYYILRQYCYSYVYPGGNSRFTEQGKACLLEERFPYLVKFGVPKSHYNASIGSYEYHLIYDASLDRHWMETQGMNGVYGPTRIHFTVCSIPAG